MEHRNKIILEWCIFTFLFLIFALSASLFFYQRAYAGKIYKNVKIGDLDLSGKTKSQVASLVEKQFSNLTSQEITLSTENKEIKALIGDTGLTLDTNSIVNDCYNIGRNRNFAVQFYKSAATLWERNDIKTNPVIDQAKYENFLKIAVEQLNILAEDAQLIIEDGQIKEIAEKDGQVVDISDLPNQIMRLNATNNKTLKLTINPIAPRVKTVNFTDAKAGAEAFMSKNVAFQYQDKVFTPSRPEIGLWIEFISNNGKITASLNENNIKAYINKIAKNFEVPKKDKKISALDGNVLDPGQQGIYVDKNSAFSQIKSQIYSSPAIKVVLATYTEDPAEIKVFPNEGLVPGRFQGKYIDVDLANQKLCMVETTNVLGCFPVSSGKPGMATPKGTFAIQNKISRQWSSKYGLWMPWWQAFSGAYGFHELPEWPNGYKEGADHLGKPVSHGCVRLGVGPAQTVYDWTDIGTPVYIH